jgi:hypothetical protein
LSFVCGGTGVTMLPETDVISAHFIAQQISTREKEKNDSSEGSGSGSGNTGNTSGMGAFNLQSSFL